MRAVTHQRVIRLAAMGWLALAIVGYVFFASPWNVLIPLVFLGILLVLASRAS